MPDLPRERERATELSSRSFLEVYVFVCAVGRDYETSLSRDSRESRNPIGLRKSYASNGV